MKVLRYVLFISVVIYLLIVGFLYVAQESFLFQPKLLDQDHQFGFDHGFEEINLAMKDGAVLNALHFKLNDPKGLILYYHGNAGNLERWGEIVQYHVSLGYDVLIMDYRQYGKSTGIWSRENFLSDASAFYQYAAKKYPEEDIVVYGRSLGTGFASWVASKFSPGKLILETPYTSVASMGNYFYPLVPSTWLIRYNFSPIEYLADVQCPIWIFHGTADLIVPYSIGKDLFDYYEGKKRIEFVTIPGGGHNDLIDYQNFRSHVESVLE